MYIYALFFIATNNLLSDITGQYDCAGNRIKPRAI